MLFNVALTVASTKNGAKQQLMFHGGSFAIVCECGSQYFTVVHLPINECKYYYVTFITVYNFYGFLC